MGTNLSLDTDPLRDRTRLEGIKTRAPCYKLGHSACSDLHDRYKTIVTEMKRVRRDKPLTMYNDTYWGSGATRMSHLCIIGQYYGNAIVLFQFEGSESIYLLFEDENPFYHDATIELRQWFFDHEIHETHRLMFTVLKEPVPRDDGIYIIKDAKLRLNDSPILVEVPLKAVY